MIKYAYLLKSRLSTIVCHGITLNTLGTFIYYHLIITPFFYAFNLSICKIYYSIWTDSKFTLAYGLLINVGHDYKWHGVQPFQRYAKQQ